MKVVLPKDTKDKSSYKLCIGLKPEVAIDHTNSDKKPIEFTCSHQPGVDGAPTFTLKVYPFEDGWSCEHYIRTLKSIDDIIKGQGLTTNAQKVQIIRQLFSGGTLTAFENEMPGASEDPITNHMYSKGLAAMARVVFPENAARNQKKAMKKLKKPIDMTFRMYANRVSFMNNCFKMFPPLANGNTPRPMGREEFHEMLHDALPKRNYQDVMQRFDFDPTDVTLPEFIDWVTKRCEPFDDKAASSSKMDQPIPKKKRQQSTNSKKEGEPPAKRGRYCLLHGHQGHTTDQCKVMKAMAEEKQKEKSKFPYKSKKDFKSGNDAHAMEQTKEYFESFLVSEAYTTALAEQVGGICNKLFKGFKRSLEEDMDLHAMEITKTKDNDDDENEAYDAMLKLNKADDKPFDESE